MNLFQRLIKYQAIRFPIKILGFTTLASVISSAAILNYEVSIWQIVIAYFAILLFMFHIRVIDESRDFTNDKLHHPNLPIHSGLISLKQLFILDLFGILIVVTLSILNSLNLFYIAVLFLLFTTLAWKDFFLRKFLKGKNILYHIINSPQMIILQLYIFTLYTGKLEYSTDMWILVLFMYVNIFILEVVRKIKISGEESATSDTYSFTLGYKKSILFLYLLSILSFGIFFWLMISLQIPIQKILIFSVPFFFLSSYSVFQHIIKKSKISGKVLLLSTVIQYVGLNALICIFQV